MSYTMHHVTNIATCMITALVVGPQYGNPHEWQRDVLFAAQQVAALECSTVPSGGESGTKWLPEDHETFQSH